MESPRKRAAPENENEQEGTSAKQSKLNMVYPFTTTQSFNITPPFIGVGNGLDISNLTLNLKIGKGLYFDNGDLSVVNSNEFNVSPPLSNQNGTIILKFNPQLLFINDDGELALPGVTRPLEILNKQLMLSMSKGLTTDSAGLTLDMDPIFYTDKNKYMMNVALPLDKADNILQLKFANGLGLLNSQLECTMQADFPLLRTGDRFHLLTSNPLMVENSRLGIRTTLPLHVADTSLKLKYKAPLHLHTEGLGLQIDRTLKISNSTTLAVRIDPNGGLVTSPQGIGLNFSSLTLSSAAPRALSISTPTKPVLGHFTTQTNQRIRYKFARNETMAFLLLTESVGTIDDAFIYRNKYLEIAGADIANPGLNTTFVVPLTGSIKPETGSVPALVEFVADSGVQVDIALIRITTKSSPALIIETVSLPSRAITSLRIRTALQFTYFSG
ncbi:fiber protein [unidentified adenovirus]|nr:fiber protein [unidentified adenovirus]